MSKYNVVVSDAEGVVLFLEQVEIGNEEERVLTDEVARQREAREAILDAAESVRMGIL